MPVASVVHFALDDPLAFKVACYRQWPATTLNERNVGSLIIQLRQLVQGVLKCFLGCFANACCHVIELRASHAATLEIIRQHNAVHYHFMIFNGSHSRFDLMFTVTKTLNLSVGIVKR